MENNKRTKHKFLKKKFPWKVKKKMKKIEIQFKNLVIYLLVDS